MLMKKMIGTGRALLQKYWKSILYYTAVAAVLGAVACAAEVYRQDAKTEEVVLPAVEISEAEKAERFPQIILTENMNIVRSYSEKPVWNEMLAQWETHRAIDIEIPGGNVYALSDGIIAAIGYDRKTGNYIEIESDELVLRYALLDVNSDIREGDCVKAGEMIGILNKSMLCEDYMEMHLHLEAVYGGKIIDPALFMPNEGEAASNS